MTGGTVYYDDVGIDSEASACFYPALMSHFQTESVMTLGIEKLLQIKSEHSLFLK